MKRWLTWFVTIGVVLFVFACKKDKGLDPAVAGLHITLLSGDNQTDTAGKKLPQNIWFLLTQDGHRPSHCYVRFEKMDCDNNVLSEEWDIRDNASTPPADSMKIYYVWELNGKIGNQYLKVILLDSIKQAKDSLTVTATAVKPEKGWYRSGCAPLNTFSVSFCKLPSGRILSALHRIDFPYYSDDEGATWSPLKTLPAKYDINKLIATPQNEVFLGADKEGVFYSTNGGQTWEKRNNGLPVAAFSGDIYYTKSGKLFAFTIDGIFLSNDKGANWHEVTYGLYAYAGFSDASSMSDGTLLAVHDRTLMKSTDGGEGWQPVYPFSGSRSESLFIDDNDDIYVSGGPIASSTYGLYVSKNKGQTFTLIYTPNFDITYGKSITRISKYNGTYYFYATEKNVLMKTTDFNNYTMVSPPVAYNNSRFSASYIVTDHNRYVLSTEMNGLYYYIP